MTQYPIQSELKATEEPGEYDAVLGNLTAALSRGEVAEGAQLMERALLLNVHWDQLTSAVQVGIERGYRRNTLDTGA